MRTAINTTVILQVRERQSRNAVNVRHSYATAVRYAEIDWKALSKRIGHADVAFTMKQYVQTDLEADCQVANTLAQLIIGDSLASIEIADETGDTSEDAA
jgi:hypothetical protein